MNPTVLRRATAARRRIVTRPTRPPAPLPHDTITAFWPPIQAIAPWDTLPTARHPWNAIRWALARSWPRRWTGHRHPRPYRFGRLVWSLAGLAVLALAVVVASVGLLVAPVWWFITNAAGAGLVLAGWTPPAVLDPTSIDPAQALFDEHLEHARPHYYRHQPNQPKPPPAPRPVEPPSLEERQVAASEANANALQQLALVEATRPHHATAAPSAVTYRRRRGPLARAAVFLLVLFLPGLLLLAAGAVQYARNGPPPALQIPTTTSPYHPPTFDPANPLPEP